MNADNFKNIFKNIFLNKKRNKDQVDSVNANKKTKKLNLNPEIIKIRIPKDMSDTAI